MLELSAEQVAGLAQIDERGFVERVRQDLVKENPAFADDDSLSSRLWTAYRAATKPRSSICASPATCSALSSSMRMHSGQPPVDLDEPVVRRDEELRALRVAHHARDVGHDARVVEPETAMVPDATGRRQRGVPHERCGAA